MSVNTTELQRILDKGWTVQIDRQRSMNSWDVKMAISRYYMDNYKYMGIAGFSKSLDEALLACELMILNRWDELHPEADKDIYGFYPNVIDVTASIITST